MSHRCHSAASMGPGTLQARQAWRIAAGHRHATAAQLPGAGSCPLKCKTGSACLAEPGQGRAMGQGRRGFCLDKEREGGADGVLRGH